MLRGAAVFRAIDVGRCDVGDPRVIGREDWGVMSLVLLEGKCRSCGNEGRRLGLEARRVGTERDEEENGRGWTSHGDSGVLKSTVITYHTAGS